MEEPQVSIRELRNRGGEVVARVQAGEPLTVTHAGLPVARIVPISPPAKSAEALVAAWRHLPRVDLAELRRDIDELIDPALPLGDLPLGDLALDDEGFGRDEGEA
jgi:prevent-host-death family protein